MNDESKIMDDRDFKKIFKAHRVDIFDEGFSERIIGMLPERKSILPQIIMVVSAVIGLVLVFSIYGFDTMQEQIYSLSISVGRIQMPSLLSCITYLSIPVMAGLISYSIAQVSEY